MTIPAWTDLSKARWYISAKTARWTPDDAKRFKHSRIEWQLDGKGKTSNLDYSDRADVYTYGEVGAPASNVTFVADSKVFPTWARALNWGRHQGIGGGSYACPFDWHLVHDETWYQVPNMWMANSVDPTRSNMQVSHLMSNWMDYAYIDLSQPTKAQSITVYAFRSGDRNQPVALKVNFTPDKDGKGNPVGVCGVDYLYSIYYDSSDKPSAFIPQFNYKLAHYRDEKAWAEQMAGRSEAGCHGWNGQSTDLFAASLLDLGSGKALDYGKEPIVWFPLDSTDGVVGTVQEMYLQELKSDEAEAEYAQTFTLCNDTDMQQSLKTNDYSHAVTETWAWSWGYKWGMNQKVTIKWETDLALTIPFASTKAKFTLQMEAGFTEEWNEQTTHTLTDTKTLTMGFQAIAVPARSCMQVKSLLNKVTGTGTLGRAVRIDHAPQVRVQPWNPEFSGWGSDYKAGQVGANLDLSKVCETIGMTTVRNGWTRKSDGKHMDGTFVVTTTPFKAKFAAEGGVSVAVVDEPKSVPEQTVTGMSGT